MDPIKVNSAEDVQKLYKDNGVSETRTNAVNDKFVTVPDKFTVYGLDFKDITIEGVVNPNVPVLSISEDGSKYITVGTFKQSHTDKATASKITKAGDNEGHYLVVNNRRVHTFTEGMSEAEIVAFCQGKTFKSKPSSEDLKVFQPTYVNRKPVYPGTAEEALKLVKPKSFRVISVKEPKD